MKNILFYKYVTIEDVESFQKEHLALCKFLNLKGKVLVANEGINGCLTGDQKDVESYMQKMHEDPRFKDLEFKVQETNVHNFRKTIVRIRPQIITTRKWDASPEDAADYIEPEQLQKLYDSGEEFYIIDARNDYECKVGRFKNAILPPIEKFSEWGDFVKSIEHLKDKKVVTYCTGGIRCEKASAYMKGQGFKDVAQLHGGIIRYGEHCGDQNWEGKCFVFDERVVVNIDPKKQTEPITKCEITGVPADKYYNCKHVACDKRFIASVEGIKITDGCCSKQCKNIMHMKGEQKAKQHAEL